MQCSYAILLNRTLETRIIFLTNVTPINLVIKKEHSPIKQSGHGIHQKENLPPFSCHCCKIIPSTCTFCLRATEKRLCQSTVYKGKFLLWVCVLALSFADICGTDSSTFGLKLRSSVFFPLLTQSPRHDILHGISQCLKLSYLLIGLFAI